MLTLENEQQVAGSWGEGRVGAFQGKGEARMISRDIKGLLVSGDHASSALLEVGVKTGGRKSQRS